MIALKKKNNEPDWLTLKREVAWESYQNFKLPDRVSHLWRYSDPSWFDLDRKVVLEEKYEPMFVLSNEALSKGVQLLELNNALNGKSEIIKENLGKLTKIDSNKIVELNSALWNNGIFLYVPQGLVVEEPIISSINREKARANNSYEALRILVILEENSSVSLIDEISSCDTDNYLTNVVVEIYLAKNAKLNYLNLQTHYAKTTHHLFLRAMLGEQAELNNLIVALGGKISKADLGTTLNGSCSKVTTYGIVLGDGIQRFDHHTTIEHISPYTKSALDFRVVLKDKACSAYTGNLKIRHEAHKSDAYQENRNLLLSDEAKAESIPELEILTNDVTRCSHGVTVGQVDKDQIYYLMSRGLNQKEAEKMIIEGFIEPTISRIPDENMKLKIQEKIKNKLENL